MTTTTIRRDPTDVQRLQNTQRRTYVNTETSKNSV
jgi:hypothetical protein